MSGESMLHPTKYSTADNIAIIEEALNQLYKSGQSRKHGSGVYDVHLATRALTALSRLKEQLEPRQPSLF